MSHLISTEVEYLSEKKEYISFNGYVQEPITLIFVILHLFSDFNRIA